MFVVVSYDISNDRRRTKVMKKLKNFGNHVQESVFECELEQGAYHAMRAGLEKLIASREDNVRFYFLDEDAVARIEVIGDKPVERARAFYIIERPDPAQPFQIRVSGPPGKELRLPPANRPDT